MGCCMSVVNVVDFDTDGINIGDAVALDGQIERVQTRHVGAEGGNGGARTRDVGRGETGGLRLGGEVGPAIASTTHERRWRWSTRSAQVHHGGIGRQ